MRSILVVGNSLRAWRFARDAARGGGTVRFLVPPGVPDAMEPVFDRAVDWPGVYDLPRHARVNGHAVTLPFDPLDVIRAIGPVAWTLDVAGLVRRPLRHRASLTVGDIARRDLGRRLAERYALPWLAARYGSADAPASELDSRPPIGWIRLSDGESHVRDAIWASGGDVIEDVQIRGVERVVMSGAEHVVALETEYGLEHVEGELFVDSADPNHRWIAEYDGPDAVVEHTRPVDGVWREVRHDGAVFRFGPKATKNERSIPDLENVRRIGPGPFQAAALSPIDPFLG